MVMKAKVVFLEFQKEGKNFFPVEPDGFLNKCVECGFCDRYKLTEFLNTKKIILTDQFDYGRPETKGKIMLIFFFPAPMPLQTTVLWSTLTEMPTVSPALHRDRKK